MTTFSYSSGDPDNLVAGGAASMADIKGPFEDVETFLNGNIDTTNLATSAKPVTLKGDYRTITLSRSGYTASTATGTYILEDAGLLDASGSSSAAAGRSIFPFEPTDHAVSGLTAKLRLRVAFANNATAPTSTFTFGLYPVTVAGAANQTVVTLGTVVSGSTVAFVAPSASTAAQSAGSDFTLPSAGVYALGVVISGAITALSSHGLFTADLQLHHV